MVSIKLFTAEWCGPCHMLKSILDQKGLKVDTIDVDDEQELIKEFGVKSVPTLLIKRSKDDFELVKGFDEIVEAIETNK
jgi:thioredoxin 1